MASPASPVLWRWRHEGQEFKAIFHYIGHLKNAWAMKPFPATMKSRKTGEGIYSKHVTGWHENGLMETWVRKLKKHPHTHTKAHGQSSHFPLRVTVS